ncbi:MAG: ABC transporter substrate-binding protein [Caldilineales bacterium]
MKQVIPAAFSPNNAALLDCEAPMNRRDELQNAIALLEAQRAEFGDPAVDASLAAMRQALAAHEQAHSVEQRKFATVIFADIVDFARLAEQRDPEDVRELQRAFFTTITAPILEYGGVIEKYIGDAVMAVFGVPGVHEDDAERAVRAGLAMQAALAALNVALGQTHGVHLEMRIGIHTGTVVATNATGSGSFMVSGDTVNLAFHLQEAAPPKAVVVSDATQRLVSSICETEPLGQLHLHRRAEQVTAYRVVRLRTDAGKLRGVAGLDSPLVGRQYEYEVLRAAVERLGEGRGGLMMVVGEAGIGKSRLVAEVRKAYRVRRGLTDALVGNQSAGVRVHWIEGRCLSYDGTVAYHLWQDLLREAVGASLDDPPEVVADALQRLIASLCPYSQEANYAFLARLMALPLAAEWETKLDSMGAPALQRHTFGAMKNVVGCAAQNRPLVIVCEDLHWGDPSSLALLKHLAPLTELAPLLMLCIFRPEPDQSHPVWEIGAVGTTSPARHTLYLRLQPLSTGDSETLLTNLLGMALPARLAGRILDQSEGNPFYVEEIIRSLIAQGALVRDPAAPEWRLKEDVAAIAIPETLQNVLAARIDRLDERQRHVLQMAAVIGRIFPERLLAAIAGEIEDLDECLSALVRQELIRPRASEAELEYIFKHALTQEAAYNGVLRRQRRMFHRRVAEALETLFPERVEELLSLLAYHWERSDEPQRAVSYLLRVGDRARLAYAHIEAIDSYRRALALLRKQGDDEGCARALMRLGLVHSAAFDHEEASKSYRESFVFWSRSQATRRDDALLPAPQPHRRMWGIEPKDWDPNPTFDYELPLFSGLLEESPELEAVPDIARSWEILDGGHTYVFHLREDVRWSDGYPVTADDFEFAWKRLLDPAGAPMNARKRALDPSTGLRSAGPLHDVRGAQAYHAGKSGDPGSVGVHAVDPLTLVVELERPVAYWLHIMANPATFPVPKHRVEQHGDAWCEADKIVGNGPYLLERWHPRTRVDLVRNPTYHGCFGGNAHRVELLCLPYPTGWQERLALYEAGELDYLFIANWSPAGLAEAARLHGVEYRRMPSLHSTSTCFNVRLPPFDDRRVRQAFAMAMDMSIIMPTSGFRCPERITGGFLPASMPGYSPDIALTYNPERARALLAEAGFPGGRGFPEVRDYVIMTPGSEGLRDTIETEYQRVLGVKTHCEILEWRDYHHRLATDPPHIGLDTWAANYPDPDDFMRVAYRRIQRYFGWRDPEYENLVDKARTLTDQNERIKLYRQADAILVREAAIVPNMHSPTACLIQPWVEGLFISPLSTMSLWTSLRDVILRPH